MKHFVYILIPSSGEQWFYVGYTPDPESRLKKHNSGAVTSTKQRRPYEMIVVNSFETKNEATQYERQLKKSTSKKRELIVKYRESNLEK